MCTFYEHFPLQSNGYFFKLTTERESEREREWHELLNGYHKKMGLDILVGKLLLRLKGEGSSVFTLQLIKAKCCHYAYIRKHQNYSQGPNYANNDPATVYILMLTWPYSLTVSRPTIPRSRSPDTNFRTISFGRWNQTSILASCKIHRNSKIWLQNHMYKINYLYYW